MMKQMMDKMKQQILGCCKGKALAKASRKSASWQDIVGEGF
jgi:hypothetical protein